VTACDRFAQDGPLEVERGTLDEAHLAGCPDCQAALARYRALGAAIASAETDAPPAGWEDRVRARVVARGARRRRLRGAIGLALVAAAVLVFLLLHGREQAPAVAALEVTVVDGGNVMRAGSPHPGDVLVATGAGELRAYRNGALLARCAADALDGERCARRGDRLMMRVPLPSVGRYRVALFAGPVVDRGSFDADVAGATGPVVLGDPLDVR
jgi:hypothetical protein